jgi:hypothetical protein
VHQKMGLADELRAVFRTGQGGSTSRPRPGCVSYPSPNTAAAAQTPWRSPPSYSPW